ncbi:MAG: hypothetical protein PVF15_06135 [Candidatus Bathyarchaeota archaeon]
MTEYIKREYFKPVFHLLVRATAFAVVILLLNVIGLGFFLHFGGQGFPFNFIELLVILLLAEGSLIGLAGGLMFFGYSEYRIATQGAINPAIVADQRQRWKERRLSQQKWGVRMLIVSVILIILSLLISALFT